LDESAITKVEINAALTDIKGILDSMKTLFLQYTPVAKRVSNLFFVLTDLVNVNPMYQYSLEFFRNIYKVTIKGAEKIEPKLRGNAQRAYFIKEFTSNLYRNVSRSLFVKDKLLFSFLVCIAIMREVQAEKGDGLDERSLRFLMTGGTKVTLDKPNPAGEEGSWLSDKMWASFEQMSQSLAMFKGFSDSFAADLTSWHELYELTDPQAENHVWPGKWNDLSILHKTVIMRILRPDKAVNMVQRLIVNEEELGRDYIIPPPFDMMEIYSDSNNKAPLIIVLSPGADPMIDIQELQKKLKQTCVPLSLGRGQEPAAINAIKEAQEAGTWVVLANCHLAPSFMPILDGILDSIVQDENSLFRLWLTTLPSDKFPVTVVQNGVKATLEPPQGMRNNLVRSYRNVVTQKELDECDKPEAFKRLFYGLCFFNALILERRKFGPLGWNIPYAFAMSDLRISKQQLSLYLNEFEKIPYDALNYMVAKANYGGRVTDSQDKRTISILLAEYFNEKVVEVDEHPITPSGSYRIPPDNDRVGYIEFTEALPLEDSTEIFGMHPNAEITSNIN
jgi:dynein heavy chain